MTEQEERAAITSCLPEYRNESTGEITYSHAEAVGWFNEGDAVSIWTEGKKRTAWIH